MDIDLTHPAHARAREGDLLRRPRRGHRAGPADGVPQDARRARPTPASSSTARPATSPCCAAETDEEGEPVARVRRHPGGLRPDRRDDREADHAAAAARRRGRHQVRRVLRQGGRHHLRRHPAGPRPRRRDGRPRQARGAAAGRPSGCRARATSTAPGSSAWWSRCARACAARRSCCRARTPTWSRSCSRSRCPRSPTARSRSRRSPARPATAPRSRCARPCPGVNAKGACIGPMGQRVRNVMNELHGEKIDIVDWSDDPAELVAHALSPGAGHQRRDRRRGGPLGPGGRARLPALAGDRQGGPERPPRRPAHRLAHRHPLRRGRRPSRRRRARGRGAAAGARRTDAGSALRPAAGRLADGALRTTNACAARMPATRPGPVRTCVGCRQRAAKRELLRVVAGDRTRTACGRRTRSGGTAPGRGAHLHPTTECFELAVRRTSLHPGPPGPGGRAGQRAGRGLRRAAPRARTARTDRDRPTETGAAAHEHSMSTSR